MQYYLEKIERELRLRNYSKKTIKSYLLCLKDYFNFLQENFEKMDIEKIKGFLLQKQDKGYSPQTVNLYLNAVKYFYRDVLKLTDKIDIKFAKRSKKLPIVLSRNEIEKILSKIQNFKHRILTALSYGAGLRISEAVNLKVKDVNLEELVLHLKDAKGKKDRITIFPAKIKKDLNKLIIYKESDDYVFESERGGKLTSRTAQKIFGNALKKSSIKK